MQETVLIIRCYLCLSKKTEIQASDNKNVQQFVT